MILDPSNAVDRMCGKIYRVSDTKCERIRNPRFGEEWRYSYLFFIRKVYLLGSGPHLVHSRLDVVSIRLGTLRATNV